MNLRSTSPRKRHASTGPSSNSTTPMTENTPKKRRFSNKQQSDKYDPSEYERMVQKPEFQNDTALRIDAKELTPEYAETSSLKKPLLFTGQLKELGLKIPAFGYKRLMDFIKKEERSEVFDNSNEKQSEMDVWEILEELMKPEDVRLKGPLSTNFEFSFTDLSNHVTLPNIVRQLNWSSKIFPKNEFANRGFSLIEKYLFLGMRGSFVDFHIEMTGCSAWYHVQKGSQYFFLIPGNETNIELWKNWRDTNLVGQKTIFFGTQVQKCTCIHVKAGETLLLPGGCIYAFYMPEDVIVYAGNFIHEYSIKTQLKVYEQEKKLQMGDYYVYQFYLQHLWYYIASVVEKATNRKYVRLISSDEYESLCLNESHEEHEYECYNLKINPPEFYDKRKGKPIQKTFDSIDDWDNDEPAEYNDAYLARIKPDLRSSWRKLLEFMTKLIENIKQAHVGEGIRRPHHLIKDFERVNNRLKHPNNYGLALSSKVERNSFVKEEEVVHTSTINNPIPVESVEEPGPSTSRQRVVQSTMPNLDDDLPNVDQTTSCDLSQKLWDLRKLDYFSFTLLSGDEHEIKISKDVLVARCPVFQQSLNDPNIQSLSFSTINLPALHGFVEWLYFGQIKDMSKQIDQLLELANTYKIDDLRSYCLKFTIGTLDLSNICDRLIIVLKQKNESLKQQIIARAKQMPKDGLMKALLTSTKWSKFSVENFEIATNFVSQL